MIFHHFVAIAANGGILLTGKLHFYASWIGIVEGTNPCLSAVFLPKRHTVESKWMVFGGIGLFFGFLGLRVINLPLVLWCSMLDFESAKETKNILPQFILGQTVIVLLWVLSTFWFVKITRGVMKALSPKSSGTLKAD